MTGTDPVLVQREGPVRIVKLNRPEVLNALSPRMLAALCEAVEELGGD